MAQFRLCYVLCLTQKDPKKTEILRCYAALSLGLVEVSLVFSLFFFSSDSAVEPAGAKQGKQPTSGGEPASTTTNKVCGGHTSAAHARRKTCGSISLPIGQSFARNCGVRHGKDQFEHC
jgi:hypothetical protein